MAGDLTILAEVAGVVRAGSQSIGPVTKEMVAEAEKKMLQLPQLDCPVRHIFSDGVYIREVTLPAGAVAIGHHQKHPIMNVMLTGHVSLLNEDGTVAELRAPQTFVGKPGRKIGYIHETTIWHNVYPNPTNETSVDALEGRWLDKSPYFSANETEQKWLKFQACADDRADYVALLKQRGFNQEEVLKVVENTADLTGFPAGVFKVALYPSPIHGIGLFATAPIAAGEIICPARISGMRTPAGRFTNHGKIPNAAMKANNKGDIFLVALRDITGCLGGQSGEELTVDYRQAMDEATSVKDLV